MKTIFLFLAALGLASPAFAHMQMSDPPPLKSTFNKTPGNKSPDYSMTAPLDASGANFPCKGYHTTEDIGSDASVANWVAGGTYSITIVGGATHGGGSCQVSLSYDKGKTWTAVHSYIGNCPLTDKWTFKLPTDTPAGVALFAWSWFNRIGNREMYMNCAVVTIKAGNAKMKRATAGFKSRPAMFVANVGNGITTCESKDLEFPEPGPDVDRSTPKDQTDPPVKDLASCGQAAAGGALNPPAGAPATGATPTSTSVESLGSTASVTESVPAQSTSTSHGGVFVQPSAPATTVSATSAASSIGTLTTVVQSAPTNPASTQPTGGNASQGSGAAMAVGSACTADGQWNCVNGNQFQRCASGSWSGLTSMAAGTSCTPGISMDFSIQ